MADSDPSSPASPPKYRASMADSDPSSPASPPKYRAPMADSNPSSPPQTEAPVPSPVPPMEGDKQPDTEGDKQPVGARIVELHESEEELIKRMRGLKQDLLNWRSKLDTQVETYKDELSNLKEVLNKDIEQLKLEFQELRTTLQKQQEDVTTSLRNLGMEDRPELPPVKSEPENVEANVTGSEPAQSEEETQF